MASQSHVLVYHGPVQIATFWELRHLLSLTCNPKLKMDESDCPFQLGDFQVQCSIFSGVFSSISFSRIFPNYYIWSMSFFCRFPMLVLGNHLTLMSSWTDLKLNHFSKFSCISSLGKKTKIFPQKNEHPPTLQKNHTQNSAEKKEDKKKSSFQQSRLPQYHLYAP